MASVYIDCSGSEIFHPKWNVSTVPVFSAINVGEKAIARYKVNIERPEDNSYLCWFFNGGIKNSGSTDLTITKIIATVSETRDVESFVVATYDINFPNSSFIVSRGKSVDLEPFARKTKISPKEGYIYSVGLTVITQNGLKNNPLTIETECDSPLLTVTHPTDTRSYIFGFESNDSTNAITARIVRSETNIHYNCHTLVPLTTNLKKIGFHILGDDSEPVLLCPHCFEQRPDLEFVVALSSLLSDQKEFSFTPKLTLAMASEVEDKVKAIPSSNKCDIIKGNNSNIIINTIIPQLSIAHEIHCNRTLAITKFSSIQNRSQDIVTIDYHLSAKMEETEPCVLNMIPKLIACAGRKYRYKIFPIPADEEIANGEMEDGMTISIPYYDIINHQQLKIVVLNEGVPIVSAIVTVPGQETLTTTLSHNFSIGSKQKLAIKNSERLIIPSYYTDDSLSIATLLVNTQQKSLTSEEFTILLNRGLHYSINLPINQYQGDTIIENKILLRITSGSATMQEISQTRSEMIRFPQKSKK